MVVGVVLGMDGGCREVVAAWSAVRTAQQRATGACPRALRAGRKELRMTSDMQEGVEVDARRALVSGVGCGSDLVSGQRCGAQRRTLQPRRADFRRPTPWRKERSEQTEPSPWLRHESEQRRRHDSVGT